MLEDWKTGMKHKLFCWLQRVIQVYMYVLVTPKISLKYAFNEIVNEARFLLDSCCFVFVSGFAPWQANFFGPITWLLGLGSKWVFCSIYICVGVSAINIVIFILCN